MRKNNPLFSTLIKNTEGFLLLEVAIALVIIGLLVGGILKGRQLLETSRLQATAKNLESYRLAIQLFQDRYGALPGDFPEATTYIDSTLKNGNGNAIIDGAPLHADTEASQFWQHLSYGGFIDGITNIAPIEKIGGMITVEYTPTDDLPGHWLVLGAQNGEKGNGALLTPIQARVLFEKLGGTKPDQGSVRVQDAPNAPSGSCIQGGRFNSTTKKPACVVYVAF